MVTAESGVEALSFCRRVAWSPELSVETVDLVGTTYTGEAEDFRGRTLVRYAEEALAAQALASLRLAVEQCPEEEIGRRPRRSTPGPIRHAGDEAFTITHRYRSEYGFDTGLEVDRRRPGRRPRSC